jgi:hypothetical protein
VLKRSLRSLVNSESRLMSTERASENLRHEGHISRALLVNVDKCDISYSSSLWQMSRAANEALQPLLTKLCRR